MAPKSTPWEPLYIETGILTPESIVLKNRINYMDKLKENQSSILKTIREDQDHKGWWETNMKTREEQGIPLLAPSQSEENRRKEIKKVIHGNMMDTIKRGTDNRTKAKYYMDNKRDPKPGSRAEYMDKCNRMEANIIFRARTRMLKVKTNFRNMFQDTVCRLCKEGEESQEHVLEHCKNEKRKMIGKVTTRDIFEENPVKLKTTAETIRKVMDLIECSSPDKDRATRLIRACAN